MINSVPWWAWLIAGFAIGSAFSIYIYTKRKDGTIHIKERPDQETDVALFEFDVSPKAIPRMKQVIFKVIIDPPESGEDSQKIQGA